MKKILFILTGAILFSCQSKQEQSFEDIIENGDLAQVKTKRDQLRAQADSLQSMVGLLNERVAELDPKAAKLVKDIVSKDTLYHHFIKIQANIETEQDVQVTPEYGGVIRLMVKEGSFVRKGQLIGTISDGGLSDQLNQAKIQVDQARAQLQQAEIQRDLAKTTFERQQSLWSQKIGSEMQYLQAKTNYETSQKQVLAAKQQVSAAQKGVSGTQAQLAKTRLVAPFSGRVEQVITQSGQAVSPGTPVIRLVNPSTVKAVANVPENYLAQIQKGTLAKIALPALERTFDSQVSLISSSINPGNRTFRVEVPIPDKDGLVKPNLNAELQLNDYTSENAIVLPQSVVREDSEGKFVFVIEQIQGKEGIAKKVYVEIGPESNGQVEVLNGIKAGQIIITEGPGKLQEGDRVLRSK
ncbi:efflux RND transporter periplasmic adaptor subunit [Weeksellaceae bacterium KMM 9713]|uniref:Efflux RND transporter periplasmic adaptor subunit n=1 Tax=Profundicola chukchiensis TaxID=2961959 RepID=A0A9X4MTZ1_9FLAO|nr:efflux RND transporter periplasmic adaptor subunit [Profundicola chukchiensis]MDG4944813.1 efflux RND transporter periplasmic adaptor subunit [Profundicola chukchiensis]